MLAPKQTQLDGARFLADRKTALLADLPRVGKTGTAIIAADLLVAQSILVVTTASGRGVWRAGFRDWSHYGRRVQVLTGDAKLRDDTDICIVSWNGLTQAHIRAQLLRRYWSVLIPDEAHAAKTFTAKRTQALYGVVSGDGLILNSEQALIGKAECTWALTGTPVPNCPLDLYPMMRALCEDRLAADELRGWPDVTLLSAFTGRYCKMRPMKVGKGPYAKRIQVFVEGRNLAELAGRLEGFYLRRTQQDVGILAPVYETMPLDAELPHELLSAAARPILAAAERGDTRTLEMHLGPLRRLTGEIKAHAVVEAIREELENGLDKIVLAYWHRDVGRVLMEGLESFGAVMLDGASSARERADAESVFLRDPNIKVFLGQILAAGEAIDLSSAKHMVFVESSFVPKDMLQMSLRVTNHKQKVAPLVRVATLAGSVDDGLQQVLMRKWTAIRETMT